ncbi:MAG: DUF2093 domain-containing protein [Alphaproteobacteria bacterium]|jgi:hypothetical protein|nr:DUF2093 domain-containing protein [Alphaproteobacteria bacterium]MBT4711552.1 DUF2093 domain-containing protein [Alphaproteobacteria bacterium]
MKDTVSNRPPGPEAVLKYGTPEFEVITPGAYVTCAITGSVILVEHLKYWSVEFQEAYVDAAAANQRLIDARGQAAEDS